MRIHNERLHLAAIRTSGWDHAFASEGDFISSLALENPELGMVEYQVTGCGYLLPLAYVMPGHGGEVCDTCLRTTIVALPHQPLTAELDPRGAQQ